MKTIAFYLPQFHNIPENDEWWGDGFTEWTNVKKAKPLFEEHYQPNIPLNGNYYNLLDNDVKRWQAKLAHEYGVYGFCYYHYWFNGKMLLEKPMEQMLEDKSIDMPFCISWANEPWTKAWVNEKKVLLPQYYGGKKEWEEHFDYLLPFFMDKRYIKEDSKPLVVIYRPEVIPCLNEMLDYWQDLARQNGLPGLIFAHQYLGLDQLHGDDSRFKYDIEFQPVYAEVFSAAHAVGIRKTRFWQLFRSFKRKVFTAVEKKNGIDLDRIVQDFAQRNTYSQFSYDDRWSDILSFDPMSDKSLPGAFVNWDNTPRKGEKGKLCADASPDKFYRYMKQLIVKSRNEYKSEYLFITAWNEWAEGSYLEPDERWGYGYLAALKRALIETGEFPDTEG